MSEHVWRDGPDLPRPDPEIRVGAAAAGRQYRYFVAYYCERSGPLAPRMENAEVALPYRLRSVAGPDGTDALAEVLMRKLQLSYCAVTFFTEFTDE